MGTLALYAVGIDEVRDLLGATGETADRVRPLAAELWPPAEPPRRGLLDRLKRRPAAPPPDPARPTPDDVESVLAGRFAPMDRAAAAWEVVEGLTGRLALGTCALEVDRSGVEGFDYALAKAGAPADAGLGRLLASDARLGLAPAAGRRACYLPHARAARGAALLSSLRIDDPAYADLAARLEGFLAGFDGWAAAARADGRPAPDLVGFTRWA